MPTLQPVATYSFRDRWHLDAPPERVHEVLADIRVAVSDWRAMTARASEIATELVTRPSATVPAQEAAQGAALLEWLVDGEFVFRTTQPTDSGLRYGFERNTTAGGLRDAHDWLRQGRFRFVAEQGDAADPATWFEDDARGARVKAELARIGVGGRGPAPGPAPKGLGDLDGLDLLDDL